MIYKIYFEIILQRDLWQTGYHHENPTYLFLYTLFTPDFSRIVSSLQFPNHTRLITSQEDSYPKLCNQLRSTHLPGLAVGASSLLGTSSLGDNITGGMDHPQSCKMKYILSSLSLHRSIDFFNSARFTRYPHTFPATNMSDPNRAPRTNIIPIEIWWLPFRMWQRWDQGRRYQRQLFNRHLIVAPVKNLAKLSEGTWVWKVAIGDMNVLLHKFNHSFVFLFKE